MTDYSKFDCLIGNGLEDDRGNTWLNEFNNLPDQAKTLFTRALVASTFREIDFGAFSYLTQEGLCSGCQSPIEYTFNMALGIAYGMRARELIILDHNNDDCIACSCEDVSISTQYKIEVDGNTYYADFLIMEEYSGSQIDGYVQNEDIVIECDGYDYHHANKEQVAHDYDRENAIKKAGYSVIRFTGSQIYHNPMKCANDVIDYLIEGMNRRREEFLRKQENEK